MQMIVGEKTKIFFNSFCMETMFEQRQFEFLVELITNLKTDMNQKFSETNQKIAETNQKIAETNQKIERIDNRLIRVEDKVEGIQFTWSGKLFVSMTAASAVTVLFLLLIVQFIGGKI